MIVSIHWFRMGCYYLLKMNDTNTGGQGMETKVIVEKILQIVNDVLEENGNNMVVTEDSVINLPFTVDGSNFNTEVVLDSIEIVTIIVEVENKFLIEIPDDYMINFRTVNDLANIVKEKIDDKLE